MRTMLLVLALSGCKVVDAPETLEELVVFGFENYEDDGRMRDTHAQLVPLVDANHEDLSDGYRVDQLTADNLANAGVEGVDVTEILGAMGVVDYTHDLDTVLEVISAEDKADRFENLLAYEVTETTDRECFLARECDTLEQTVDETADVTLLGEATRTYTMSYRWIVPEDEDEAVLYIRTLSPEEMVFTGSAIDAQVHQQYAFVALYPEGDVARRVEAFWVDFEVLGADIPDTFAVDNAVNGMASQAERVDEWIDAH
jgi:hypothetical protein